MLEDILFSLLDRGRRAPFPCSVRSRNGTSPPPISQQTCHRSHIRLFRRARCAAVDGQRSSGTSDAMSTRPDAACAAALLAGAGVENDSSADSFRRLPPPRADQLLPTATASVGGMPMPVQAAVAPRRGYSRPQAVVVRAGAEGAADARHARPLVRRQRLFGTALCPLTRLSEAWVIRRQVWWTAPPDTGGAFEHLTPAPARFTRPRRPQYLRCDWQDVHVDVFQVITFAPLSICLSFWYRFPFGFFTSR